jgi:hypothetical protein
MNDFIKAGELMRRDLRFRRIVDSIVARTLQEHGAIDPARAAEEAHDIARKVAALLLHQIYDGDAELLALRAELEHWRRFAEKAVLASPLPILITKPTTEGER